jgi:hypothetical protein
MEINVARSRPFGITVLAALAGLGTLFAAVTRCNISTSCRSGSAVMRSSTSTSLLRCSGA